LKKATPSQATPLQKEEEKHPVGVSPEKMILADENDS